MKIILENEYAHEGYRLRKYQIFFYFFYFNYSYRPALGSFDSAAYECSENKTKEKNNN